MTLNIKCVHAVHGEYFKRSRIKNKLYYFSTIYLNPFKTLAGVSEENGSAHNVLGLLTCNSTVSMTVRTRAGE